MIFGGLGLRLATLASSKVDVIIPSESTFDPVAASAKIADASTCPVQSCIDGKFTELPYLLDTSKYAGSKNSKGAPSEQLPTVYVEPTFGKSQSSVAAYRVLVTVPPTAATELLWLVNADSGELVASKVFAPDESSESSTLVAVLKEPYAGVRRGASITPLSYGSANGLWQGQTFVLPAEAEAGSKPGSAPGTFGPGDFYIDTRGKRPPSVVGAEILQKAAAPTRR